MLPVLEVASLDRAVAQVRLYTSGVYRCQFTITCSELLLLAPILGASITFHKWVKPAEIDQWMPSVYHAPLVLRERVLG